MSDRPSKKRGKSEVSTEQRRHNTGVARARRAIWGGALCSEAEHTMKDARGFSQLTACPIPGVAVQSGATTARDAVEVMRGSKRVVPPLVVRGRLGFRV